MWSVWLEPRVGKGQTMLGLEGHVKDFDLYTKGSGKSLKGC